MNPAILEQRKVDLLRALRAARWNISSTARALGVSRQAVYAKMHAYGIPRPDRKRSPRRRVASTSNAA